MSALADGPGLGLAGLTDHGTGVVAADEPEQYLGPVIDLSVITEAVRRRSKLWIGAALTGLVIGAAFHFIVPAKYSAVADLYMVEPSGSGPAQAIANDVSLLETRAVAERATAALHLTVDPGTFLSTYTAKTASDVILSIKLTAASPAKAVSYDNAVANAFLYVRAQELLLQTELVVKGLATQVTSLKADLKGLTNAINSLSTGKAGSQSGNELTGLVNERSSDASQLSQIQSEEQQDLLAEQATVQGSKVLDPSAAIRVSATKVTAMDGLSGFVGGLGTGMGIVIVGAAISNRPRRRADVAAALGVPVEVSVGRYRPPRVLRRQRLYWRLTSGATMVGVVERRLRKHLESVPGATLAAVAVGPAQLAALGTARLACILASEGKRVVVADMADGHPLARVCGVKGKPGTPVLTRCGGAEFTMVVAPDDPAEMTGKGFADTDAVLVLASLAPALGAEHLATWAKSAVLVVSAGKATATRMSATTQMLHQAGITTRSAILVGAYAEDQSVGSLDGEAQLLYRWPGYGRPATDNGSGG